MAVVEAGNEDDALSDFEQAYRQRKSAIADMEMRSARSWQELEELSANRSALAGRQLSAAGSFREHMQEHVRLETASTALALHAVRKGRALALHTGIRGETG
jgi:hypothetical protein